MDDEEWGPVRKGFEFGLNFGVYQASHNPAQVYAGYPFSNDYIVPPDNNSIPNEFSLGNNQYVFRSLPGALLDWAESNPNNYANLQTNMGFNADFLIYDYPLQMRYDPSMMFGIKSTYFFNNENSLVFSLNAVSLRASGAYQLWNENSINNTDQFLEYGVFAKERRYITSLGYRTSLYINDYASWIIGLGVSSNTIEIVRNWFQIDEKELNLIQPNNPLSANTSSNSNIRNVSNTGFGFYGIIGLEGIFEEGGNLEANFRVSRDRIKLGRAEDTGESGLTGYNRVNWNFALYITWMIPPHIGDFVRASF